MQYKSISEFMTEGLAQGVSAECTVAGILLCSCVLCRRHIRNGQEEERCEKGIHTLNGVNFLIKRINAENECGVNGKFTCCT